MYPPNRNPAGYLLIELMIAIATIALCSAMLAYLQVHITRIHKEAEQYMQAVNYAHAAFEGIVHDDQDTFIVEKSTQKIKGDIPFTQIEVTVVWKTPRGMQKKVTLYGGMIEDAS